MLYNNPMFLSSMIKPQQAPELQSESLMPPPTNGNALLGDEDPMKKEMKVLYKRNLSYDNRPAIDVVRSAAVKTGVNPALLFSSAFQEGMNKAIAKPDEASEAYSNANKKGELNGFNVDGFYNYGLDTFGDRYNDLKKYLPEGFDKRFKTYKAQNEKKEWVNTAAFISNEDALIAKSAFLRAEMDTVDKYAKKKGIALDDEAKNYFTLASYNAGFGNAQKMLDKYASAKDKKAFVQKGDSEWMKVHKNISPRLSNMKIAQELLDEK
jgi:hypothetical protein